MRTKKSKKALAAAIIIMLLLFFGGIANALICRISLDKLSQSIESTVQGDAEGATRITEDFSRISFFMSITTNHDDLEDAEQFIVEFKEAVSGEDKQALKLAKSRLVAAMKQLKRLSGFGIDSII